MQYIRHARIGKLPVLFARFQNYAILLLMPQGPRKKPHYLHSVENNRPRLGDVFLYTSAVASGQNPRAEGGGTDTLDEQYHTIYGNIHSKNHQRYITRRSRNEGGFTMDENSFLYQKLLINLY